ncbi:MAG: GreA/GreB family elongation factor [Syntrophomonadaceae bacterium]|nr:GreA/GreB family elongation factor [Syntrophomonadaceae bacterium]
MISTLTKETHEKLISHLVDIEDKKDQLIEEYFPNPSKERSEFKELLSNYLNKINLLIKNVSIVEAAENDFPFVIVGSEVEVQDLENDDAFSFRIVPPFQDTLGSNDVSILSPVGRNLLLKKVNDQVIIKAPAGEFRYQIKSIKLNQLS